jgi:pimeloyl-ACP methyl ester carboxylesterase
MKPYEQGRFEDLPDTPRLAHTWFDLEERRVPVWTEHFGDAEASVRVAGSGPPLLLVHGLMTTGYSWRYAWPRLAESWTVYMPDLVGAGRSYKPDRRYPVEAIADWVAQLVRSLSIDGCATIGNSMGGYVAMWTALQNPDVLGRLLVLHAPGVPTPRMYALWAAMRLPGAESLLARLVQRDVERWAHGNVHYWDESLKSLEEAREYGAPLATDEGLRAFARYLRDGLDPFAMRRMLRTLTARRAADCGFVVPMKLVYARQDPMVPPAVGRRLNALIPEGDLQWLSEASHFAHVDATDAFLDVAMPWLDQGRQKGRAS